MNRAVPAVVLTKENLDAPVGQRIQLTFKTREGCNITIRSPIEDNYLAALQPQDRVFFYRDHRGCHHLERRPFWPRLLRWPQRPSYASVQ